MLTAPSRQHVSDHSMIIKDHFRPKETVVTEAMSHCGVKSIVSNSK